MRKSEYPESPKTLGQVIRRKRMDETLSLLDVAKKINISEGYLSRIEADLQSPTIEVMDAIAKELKLDPASYATYWAKTQDLDDSPTFQSLISSLRTKKKS